MDEQLDYLAACRTCGSLRVQQEAWCRINRPSIVEFVEGAPIWCPRCQEHDKYSMVLMRQPDGWSECMGRLVVYPTLRACIRALREQGANRRRQVST